MNNIFPPAISPLSGSIGTIKYIRMASTPAVVLFHPDFYQAYRQLPADDRLAADLSGKFEYEWQYDQSSSSYVINVAYKNGVNLAVQFPQGKAGQVLEGLANSDYPVFALVLKYKEGAKMIFDDAVVLMGMEFKPLPGIDWPRPKE